MYRLWPRHRKGLIEYDGRRVFMPLAALDAWMAVLFWLPPVVRATGIPPTTSTVAIAAHIICMYVNGFPLFAAAQRSRPVFHLQIATALLCNIGLCLMLIVAGHDPKTPMWMALLIYAAIFGASQEIDPCWAFLLVFLLAPLATIPWFLRTRAPGAWAIAGPALAAAFCLTAYHGLASTSARWRLARARLRLRIAELERHQIAQDMHDGVGSALALVGMCGDALEQRISSSHEARPILQTLQQTAREGLTELRDVLNAIAPTAADVGSLSAALTRFGASAAALSGASVSVVLQGGAELAVGTEARLALTRLFQEALSNALRHGGARTITARLGADAVEVRLELQDDGRGFDPSNIVAGRGLAGMGTRARNLGGVFEVESRPGAGTRIQVRLPREPARDGALPDERRQA